MTQVDKSTSARVHEVFVICNQRDTAPIWGYILRHQGLSVSLETSFEKAVDRWSTETPDLVVLDVIGNHQERMQLYRQFRTLSVVPILLFLPAYHETEILEAYAAGVDEVIVKPISPAIFLAKILAWGRRSHTIPTPSLDLITAGQYRLEPTQRCLSGPNDSRVHLTALELRLLHLLMSRPRHIFKTEDIIHSIWEECENCDPVLLKNVVYRLRKKIEVDPGHPTLLRTWQSGYSFEG